MHLDINVLVATHCAGHPKHNAPADLFPNLSISLQAVDLVDWSL